MQELIQQIAKDLAKGRKKRQIVEELTNSGMDQETAKQLVNKVNK